MHVFPTFLERCPNLMPDPMPNPMPNPIPDSMPDSVRTHLGFSKPELSRLLERALQRRQSVLNDPQTTFFRLLHTGDGLSGVTLERAGDVGILSLYRDLTPQHELELAHIIQEVLGSQGVELSSIYLKRRPKEAKHVANVQREYLAPELPLLGHPRAEVVVLENGNSFLIRPGSDLSTGLFSDMRPTRAWLGNYLSQQRESKGVGKVLNTFAYTCGFGVVAARAGHLCKNLDASRKVLEWGMENYALNALEPDLLDFIYGDVFDWLARFAKRGERFDTIILDPPSFARGKTRTFRVQNDYADLLRQALRCLEPDGLLLACTNHAGLPSSDFDRQIQQGAQGFPLESLCDLGAGLDYFSLEADHLKVRALRRVRG
jgi:23S rRNA (cytosine1962-C5)-methyltransferase